MGTASSRGEAGGEGLNPLLSSDLTIATILVDADGRISYFSHTAEELTGFTRSEIIGRDIQVLLNYQLPFDSRRSLAVAPSDRPKVHQVRRADGTALAVHVYRHPVPQPGGPPATLLMAVDVTERDEAAASLGLLNSFFKQAEVGFAILDTQMRYMAINEALARLNHRPLAEHLGRRMNEVVESSDWENYHSLLQSVLDTGEPIINLRLPTRPTNNATDYAVRSVSWYRLTEDSGDPMGLCGVITDISENGQATLDAAQSRARLGLLSEVGALQGTTLDFRRAAQGVADLLATDYCDFVVVDVIHDIITGATLPDDPSPDNLVSRIGAASRISNETVDLMLASDEPRPASHLNVFAEVLSSNRPQLLQEPSLIDAELAVDPERVAAAGELKIGSVVIAPLRARDSTLGTLTCARIDGRQPFNNEDVLLLSEIANRTALTIDNARLYRNEKQIALTLQVSLLPRRMPTLPEVSLTHRYQPNRSDLRAGGDWFDTIPLPGRRVAIVVGDVVGHSIQSAAAMGHFRTAVRTLASVGLEPATLLTRLNDLSSGFGDDVTATCVYVLYDPLTNSCVLGSAGHPPPILALPGEGAQAYELAGGPLLGALPDAEYRATKLATPPGTRLLLYTDGVVEARGICLDDGIQKVVHRMQSGRPAAEICDRVMADSPSAEDDRTVLLAEFHGLDPSGSDDESGESAGRKSR